MEAYAWAIGLSRSAAEASYRPPNPYPPEDEMLGPGRPAKRPTIGDIRELTIEEVSTVARGRQPAVKKLRDSHHMVARLLAMGHRPGRVAEMVGYSLGRISTLQADPSFQELVASYRVTVDESYASETDEYFETSIRNRVLAARLINDKLTEAEPDDVSFKELVAIHADFADRTGYPKRSVAVNVNVDFAARLDRAIARSSKLALAVPDSGSEGGAQSTTGTQPVLVGEVIEPHQSIRRRA